MIAGQAVENLGYPAPASARPYYHSATEEYEKLSLKMADAQRQDPSATFDRRSSLDVPAARSTSGVAPRPKMRLRLRPLVDNDPRAQHADLPEDWQPSSGPAAGGS
jgi:hypothetical protein